MFCVGVTRVVLTVYDEDLLQPFVSLLAREILYKFFIVGVAGVGVDAGECGADLVFVAEDGDLLVAAHDLCT